MIPKIAWAEDSLLWTEKWGRPNWWWWQWVIIIIIILILILILIIIIIQVERNYHSIAVQSCCRCCYGLRIRGWKLVKANNCPSITFDIVANLSEGWIFGNRKNCIFIRYLAVEVFNEVFHGHIVTFQPSDNESPTGSSRVECSFKRECRWGSCKNCETRSFFSSALFDDRLVVGKAHETQNKWGGGHNSLDPGKNGWVLGLLF